MPPEKTALLFTTFFSTKEGGTGRGPTSCQELIEQHHGEIIIDSKVGRGATCLSRLTLASLNEQLGKVNSPARFF